MVQCQIHATETLNYLADYLEIFHATKVVFTTCRTSTATDSIAHVRVKDQIMQLKVEHMIEDEERAAHGEAFSHSQKEHRKTEDNQRLQKVYNSTVNECTSFDFIKIYPSASARVREISKSAGGDPPDERASVSRTSVFQCTTFDS